VIHRGAGITLPLNLLLILNLKNKEDEEIIMPSREKQQQELQLTNISRASGHSASNKLATFSVKASAVTAARMLDFVREMSLGSEDFSQRQSDYWIFLLQDYPPPLIERAFHEWVKQSKHMPVPSEIVAILDSMVKAEHQDELAKETEHYLVRMRETRRQLAEAGQPYGEAQYHELMKKALEIVKSFPSLPDPKRVPAFKERLVRAEQGRATLRKPTGNVNTSPGVSKLVG
jgi:hypothetical protein